MIRLFLLVFITCLTIHQLHAQKRPLTHDDFDTWKRIRGEKISPDGNYVVYHLTPGKGDATMKIKTHDGREVLTYPRAASSTITWDSRYVIFDIKPALDSLNTMKRNKVKENELPKDSLGIYDLQSGSLTKIGRVKGYKTGKKWSGHVYYMLEEALPEPKVAKDSTQKDSSAVVPKKKKKGKKVSKKNGYHLVVRQLESGTQDTLKYVTDYAIAEEAGALLYHTTGMDSTIMEGVYYLATGNTPTPMCRGKGKYKQLSLDKPGKQAGFVVDADTTKALIRNFQLRYWTTGMDSALNVADSTSAVLPQGWGVSENGALRFSDNGQKLYFGTAPRPVVQDTTLLPDEMVQVEIWSYQDQRLHTQQNAELDDDTKKSYLTVFHTKDRKLVHPATANTEVIRTTKKANADHALGLFYSDYNKYVSWEGFPRRQDVYYVNLKTGNRKLVVQDLRGWANIAASGKYLYWYNAVDTSYYTYDVASSKIIKASQGVETSLSDELNDQPNYPSAYGVAGWTKNDERLVIYDRYDLFALDPKGNSKPEKLTNGRETSTRYRFIDLDKEEEAIKLENAILYSFNETSRDAGYAVMRKGKGTSKLIGGAYHFSNLEKAEQANKVIFTKENHELFPDLLTTTLDFKNLLKLSDANPEIANYLWGTVELYTWTSLDGEKLEGLLYKPENFDPSKQYPLMVYFYERNSDRLHRHWGAVPIRSIINPTFYASRGYVIFIPDIPYRIGYPGESAYNAVIPGVTSLIGEGYIDKAHIGTQGHSWGGYQTAYLVTKTNMFAAAESGAPVSNMISAYGGIRWETGLSRMFQYEHTQSRIGGTLWEYPLRFIENSPIFYMDKVETPMLIMHNDKDGHVPWYQGIEMFVALRRLGKPAWMLNYNGEPHWPTKWENIRDFNVRMQQFFDHYLKEEPMPKWMKEGVPAVLKGIEKGYEASTDE